MLFIVLILLLGAMESTLPQIFHLDYARPLLMVPLVLYFALTLHTLEGAGLSLAAGFVQDAVGGWPSGLCAFSLVSLFVLSRMVLVGIRAESRLFETVFVFLLAIGHHLITLGLIRSFGPPAVPLQETPWMAVILWSALATAVASPLVLGSSRWLHGRLTAPAGGI